MHLRPEALFAFEDPALFSIIFFDRDARRSGPTIHFHGFVVVVVVVVVTLVQKLAINPWKLDI